MSQLPPTPPHRFSGGHPLDLLTADSALLELFPTAVYVCEAPSGKIVRHNRRAAELWGREPPDGAWDTCFCGSYRIFRPDGTPVRHAESPMAECFRTGAPVRNAETVIERPDGSRVTVLANVEPLVNDRGEIVGGINAFHDVTLHQERQSAHHEEALRQSEERLRLALLAGNVGLWDWDIVHDRVYWTDRIYDFHGLPPGSFGGTVQDFSELVHPEDRERVGATIQRVMQEGGHYKLEFRTLRPDGEVRWLATSGQILFDREGNPQRLLGATTDVTERHLADEALRREHDFRRAMETSMLAGVAVIDADGRQIYVNPAFCRLVGWTEDELIGCAPPFPYWPPEELENITSSFRATLGGEVPVRGFEMRLCHKNGNRFDARVLPAPLQNADGQTVGWLACVYDISDHIRLEAELRERAEALMEADRRKDQFLAMLAHELRNPLSPILTAAAVLKTRGADEEWIVRYATAIERQGRHLARLVDDLLEVSRINEGKIALRPEPIDLRRVVEQAVDATRPLLDHRRHALKLSLPEGPLALEADPTRLVQVLTNLLSNAARYTDSGGRISVSAEFAAETAPAARPAALLRVSDNGRGIETELLAKIFEPFVQGDRDLARTEGGLGIGLTLARSLVELHGGTLTAASPGPGQGSEFTVSLPLPP